jgi:hypothetical protein
MQRTSRAASVLESHIHLAIRLPEGRFIVLAGDDHRAGQTITGYSRLPPAAEAVGCLIDILGANGASWRLSRVLGMSRRHSTRQTAVVG